MHSQHFTGRKIHITGEFEQLDRTKVEKALRRLAAKLIDKPEEAYMIIVGDSIDDDKTIQSLDDLTINKLKAQFPDKLVISETSIDEHIQDVNEIEFLSDLY